MPGRSAVLPPFPDGAWNFRILRMMEPAHRLVLRWCCYLAFEDVVRIDRKSIYAKATLAEQSAPWRRMFGDGRILAVYVPRTLIDNTEAYAGLHVPCFGPYPAPEAPIFDEVHGEAITRASLVAAVGNAIALARLADDFAIVEPLQLRCSGPFSAQS